MEPINSTNWLRLLRDDILKRGTLHPGSSGGINLMFFVNEDGIPVASHHAPTTEQILIPTGRFFPAEPATWHNLISFTLGRDFQGLDLEFIPDIDNTFTAKFWIISDIERNNAQFRLRATDIRTNTSLAVGTVSLNLGTTGLISPVIITGIYEALAVVPAEDIQMTLQVLSPLFGVQLGLVSRPPNETSYLTRLIPGGKPITI